MLLAKRASRWIIGKLKLLENGIDLLKLDNYNIFWGFVIIFANLSMEILLSWHL